MKYKILFIILIFLGLNSKAQNFYLEYYTNVEDSIQPEIYSVFNASIDWLQNGEYFAPEDCSNCQTIVDSNLKLKEQIKVLSKDFLSRINNIDFSPMWCPEFTVDIKRDKEPRFYNCKIYKIDKNKLIPLFKIQITFAESKRNGYHQISDITIKNFMDKENFILKTKDKNYQIALRNLNKLNNTPPPKKEIKK